MPLMKDMFDFTPVSSWVENFNESTLDESSRTRIFKSFVMLPEVESHPGLFWIEFTESRDADFLSPDYTARVKQSSWHGCLQFLPSRH